MVDTCGFILEIVVNSAEIRDRNRAELVFNKAQGKYPRLKIIWLDAAYKSNSLKAWTEQECNWKLEVVKKPSRWGRYPIDVEPPPYPGFTVLKWRWIVERTFAWIGRWHRASKDYEVLCDTQVSLIYAVMTRLMVNRLARDGKPLREVRKVANTIINQ